MCITKNVYCWHCKKRFTKQKHTKGAIDEFENCLHCGKGFDDLTPDAQQAVLMTLKALEDDNYTIKDDVLLAIREKKIFIGLKMLCRYLNCRGYVRYGCNAGYPQNDKSGKSRLDPCSRICPNRQYALSSIRYNVMKLSDQGLIYTKK